MRADCLDDGYVVAHVARETFGPDIDTLNLNNPSPSGCSVDVPPDHFDDVEITYDGFPALFKYADDSTIVAPVLGNTDIITSAALVNEFLNWSQDNCMP